MTYQRGLGSIGSVFSAASAIVEDPCLSEVSLLVLRLQKAAASKPKAPAGPAGPALPPGPATPAPPAVKGIGLCNTVKPLRAFVWARENPWVLPVGITALVGGLIGLGYLIGKEGRAR